MKSEAITKFSDSNSSESRGVWGLSTREAALLALIVLATIAVYLPSLRAGWVSDDLPIIVHNKSITSWSFVENGFTHDVLWSVPMYNPNQQVHSASYRPLEIAWFALNAHLFGVNHPAPWHAMKIALQLLVVLLCFRVAQLLTGEIVVALLAAAIFGIMPAHVEPVVWASAVPEPLSTVFMLAALIFLIGRKRGWWRGLLLSVLFYGLAILTHESAIFFPVIVFAYVMLFEDEGGEDTRPARKARAATTNEHLARALTVCVPFIAVLLLYAFARLHALGDHAFGMPQAYTQAQLHGVAGPGLARSPAQIVMTLPMVLLLYLGTLAIPGLANPVHAIEWATHLGLKVFISWGVLTVLAAVAIGLVWRSPRRKLYAFCAIWILVTLALALKIDSIWWLNEDRYLYAPSFGWSLALALAVVEIAASGARARLAVGVATAVLLLSYGIATVHNQRYWYDNLAYYSRAVEMKPHDPYYRLALADSMDEAKDTAGAAKQLEVAESIKPEDQYLHVRLAQVYMKLGRIKDFEREYNIYDAAGGSGLIKTVHLGPSAAASSTPAATAPH